MRKIFAELRSKSKQKTLSGIHVNCGVEQNWWHEVKEAWCNNKKIKIMKKFFSHQFAYAKKEKKRTHKEVLTYRWNIFIFRIHPHWDDRFGSEENASITFESKISGKIFYSFIFLLIYDKIYSSFYNNHHFFKHNIKSFSFWLFI